MRQGIPLRRQKHQRGFGHGYHRRQHPQYTDHLYKWVRLWKKLNKQNKILSKDLMTVTWNQRGTGAWQLACMTGKTKQVSKQAIVGAWIDINKLEPVKIKLKMIFIDQNLVQLCKEREDFAIKPHKLSGQLGGPQSSPRSLPNHTREILINKTPRLELKLAIVTRGNHNLGDIIHLIALLGNQAQNTTIFLGRFSLTEGVQPLVAKKRGYDEKKVIVIKVARQADLSFCRLRTMRVFQMRQDIAHRSAACRNKMKSW